MSRWFRFYDDVVDDPKVQLLTAEQFRAWVNLLCIASKNEGILPDVRALAFRMRQDEATVSETLESFYKLELLDAVELENAPISYTPHNWSARQYKSDASDPTAAKRQKSYRERIKNRNDDRNSTVTESVTVTPPRTDTEADTEQKESVAIATGTDAPIYTDSRHELWGEGVPILVSLGVKEREARSNIGRWLKTMNDDAQAVLGAIQRARDHRIHDAVPWITQSLKDPTHERTGQIRAYRPAQSASPMDDPRAAGMAEALRRRREARAPADG